MNKRTRALVCGILSLFCLAGAVEAREPADIYPEPWPGGPQFNQRFENPLKLPEMKPLQGRFEGPAMLINDNPEAYQLPGLLGSTIRPVANRGDGTFDFVGAGRVFVLANNKMQGLGNVHWFTAVAYNPSAADLEVAIRGIIYAPKITPIVGNVPESYQQGVFSGNHAVVSTSFLDFTPGRNGAFTGRLTIPAGKAVVLAQSRHALGTEVFALIDVTASGPQDRFRMATVASVNPINAKDLEEIASGKHPAAGVDADYAYAGPTRYGRANGVVRAGSWFRGERVLNMAPGTREGDLLFATRFRYVDSPTDLPKLDPVLPNPASIPGPAATSDDGSYGISYLLRYFLKNPTDKDVTFTVALTSPRGPQDADLKPLGGIMTLPIRLNGKRYNMRVDERGGGKVIDSFTLPARAVRCVRVEFTHFGNTFPPAGIEFRAQQ